MAPPPIRPGAVMGAGAPPDPGDTALARRCWQLFGVAAATYLLLLFRVQATGEEAVYSVEAYEQWYAHDWLRPTFLGGFYQRPPLYTDLIVLLSGVLGWPNCLAAARLISSLATVGSGLMVAAFTRRLGGTPARAAFAALIYLTLAEPLLYYGWLGYSDALFGALVLGGMLCSWLAARERRARWLLAGLLLAGGGFLTKALTAYVFVGTAGLLSLWRCRAWDCLGRARFWLALAPLAVPALWYALSPAGGIMAHGMVGDITAKFGQHGVPAYLRHLASFAGDALLNLLPAAGVVICALWAQRRASGPDRTPWQSPALGADAAHGSAAGLGSAAALDPDAALAGMIALVNFLPYWLAPQSGVRYLMPLYGLMALCFAGLLWPSARHRTLLLRWAMAAIAVKVVAGAWLFPAYTARVRPDLSAIAHSVDSVVSAGSGVETAGSGAAAAAAPAPLTPAATGAPLYADTDAWVGISVVALLDTAPRADPAAGDRSTARAPLVRPPPDWTDGLLLSDHREDSAAPSRLVKDFGGVQLYCRGSACR